MKASGETQAVLTLTEGDVRPIKADDIISVRLLSLTLNRHSIILE